MRQDMRSARIAPVGDSVRYDRLSSWSSGPKGCLSRLLHIRGWRAARDSPAPAWPATPPRQSRGIPNREGVVNERSMVSTSGIDSALASCLAQPSNARLIRCGTARSSYLRRSCTEPRHVACTEAPARPACPVLIPGHSRPSLIHPEPGVRGELPAGGVGGLSPCPFFRFLDVVAGRLENQVG